MCRFVTSLILPARHVRWSSPLQRKCGNDSSRPLLSCHSGPVGEQDVGWILMLLHVRPVVTRVVTRGNGKRPKAYTLPQVTCHMSLS